MAETHVSSRRKQRTKKLRLWRFLRVWCFAIFGCLFWFKIQINFAFRTVLGYQNVLSGCMPALYKWLRLNKPPIMHSTLLKYVFTNTGPQCRRFVSRDCFFVSVECGIIHCVCKLLRARTVLSWNDNLNAIKKCHTWICSGPRSCGHF